VDQELDVVFVGAHPDDIEIGCGGTVARLAKLGYRVGLIDLTDGEPTPGSPDPAVRLAEAERAAELLGAACRQTLALPNRRLFDEFAARVELAKWFRRWRPKLVVGPYGKTVTASPDHYQAGLITEAAVFYARLTKWEEHFGELAPHRVSGYVAYPLAAMRSLQFAAEPGCFVCDISDTFQLKLEAIRAYRTQFPPQREYLFRLIEAANRYYGQTAGFEAGELFRLERAVGTDDLMKVAIPADARYYQPEGARDEPE